MARLAVASSDEEDNPNTTPKVKRENVSVKQKGRKTRTRVRVQEEEQQEEEEEEEEEQEQSVGEEEQGAEGTPRGAKRRRINGDGDSIPSRTVSQDVEEDEENVGSQVPKHEFKTLPRDDDGYIPGSIVRVQLKNFVTYDFVEFRPGAYLNMIIGPNGTGKSSIACAICLGLNFPTSVLGRASDVNQFVKMGTKEGYIELELKGPKGRPNLVIRRNLTSEKKVSSFTLNGKSVSGQEIRNRMTELNVQVGNLCTFLPQDKVSSFAAMTPQELLKETQLAAGDNRLTTWHSQLIKAGKELRELKVKQDADEAAKTQAQQRVDMMEHTVRLFNERQELERQQMVLQCVMDVERYRVGHLQYLRLKKQHRILNAKVRALQKKNQPVRNRLEAMQESSKELQAEAKAGDEAQHKRVKRFATLYGQLDELGESVDAAYQKLETLKKEEENKVKEMKRLEADINKTEEEMNKPPPKTEDSTVLKAEEDQAQSDKFNLDQRHGDLKNEFRTHIDRRAKAMADLQNAEQRIGSFDDTDTIKLQNMSRWHKDTHDAILWLRANKQLFKMEVFEPPYMCMTVPDKRYQDAVEALMNSAQLRTFVAQCKEDVDTLNHHINDTQGLGRKARIVTWYRGYNEQQLTPSPMSREEMTSLGFDGYALDYVDCPEGLKWFLQRECNFHRNAIALGQRGVDVGRAMEAVGRPGTGGGATFIYGNVLNIVQRSKYGTRALNNMTRDVPKARNLTVQTVDPEVRRQAEETVRECQQQLAMFDEERKDLDRRQAEMKDEDSKIEKRMKVIREKKDAIRNVQRNRVTLENKLKRLKGQLLSLKNQPSEEQKKKKLNKELVQKNFARAEKVKEITNLMKSFIPEQEALTLIKLKAMQTTVNVDALDDLVQKKDLKFRDAFEVYSEVDRRYKATKQETAKLLNRFHEAVNGRTDPEVIAETDRIFQVRKEYFNKLTKYEDAVEELGSVEEARKRGIEKPEPGVDAQEGDLRSLDELEIACRTVEEQLEYNNNRDENVVRSYEEKKALVESLTTAMEQRQQKIEDTELKIQRTRNQWEPALRALIHEIRNKFSDAFDRIGCAGDVELMPDPDYAQWRVDIKVKFRDNEKLQLLTGQRQSGGERSLTTILYLMSLTSLAHTPFSLVDEINQGMDKRAERMVHNSMVDVTCKEESSQYFLITPKLLPDLKYHPRMRVLCVNNGEWLPEDVSGNMKTMLRSYVAAHGRAGRAQA